MGMYLELSRPAGDVSRWEKVMKRLTLLNKHYPLTANQCAHVDFQRKMDDNKKADEIYDIVQKTLVDQGVVFFGGYALSIYSHYMPRHLQKILKKIPDFDVLSEEPMVTAQIVRERLRDINVKNVKVIKHEPVGEIIAVNYEVRVGKDMICFIYEPLACHSYNVIQEKGYKINIATIDTIMSFYLAFIYIKRPYYSIDRLLCMAAFLFDVQQRNRLEQKGLLKRFSIACVGHQETMEEMRANKSEKYKELKGKQGTFEYEEYFLRYRPSDGPKKDSPKKQGVKKTRKFRKKTKRFSRFFK